MVRSPDEFHGLDVLLLVVTDNVILINSSNPLVKVGKRVVEALGSKDLSSQFDRLVQACELSGDRAVLNILIMGNTVFHIEHELLYTLGGQQKADGLAVIHIGKAFLWWYPMSFKRNNGRP